MKKVAFKAVAKDDTGSLASAFGDCTVKEWRGWHNEAGQSLLALCRERGSFRSYAVLAESLGLSMEIACVTSESDLRLKAFRAVAQDDIASLATVLGGMASSIWLRWRNKAGKDLLTMSRERNSKGALALLRRAMASPLPVEKLATTVQTTESDRLNAKEQLVTSAANGDLDAVLAEVVEKDGAVSSNAINVPEEEKKKAAEADKVANEAREKAKAEEAAKKLEEAKAKEEATKKEDDTKAKEEAAKKEKEERLKKSQEEAKKRNEERKAKEAAEAEKKAKEKADFAAKMAKQQQKNAEAEQEASFIAAATAEEESKKYQEAERKAEEEAKKKDAEEAQRKAAEDAKKKQAEEDAKAEKLKAEEEARKLKAEEEAKKKKAEEEAARKKAEEAKRLADAEAAKKPPATLAGDIKKKGKGGMFRKAWDDRYAIVKDGKFAWYKEKPANTQVEAQGMIDFRATACEAVPDPSSSSQFILRPKSGTWNNQAFKGSEEGREFIFDAAGSPQSFKAWLETINAHCQFGTRMSGDSKRDETSMSSSRSLRK